MSKHVLTIKGLFLSCRYFGRRPAAVSVSLNHVEVKMNVDQESKRIDKDFYVVKFPKENENGNIPVSVIPNVWVTWVNNEPVCWWPHFRSEEEKKRAVMRKMPFNKENCQMCPINIKYRTNLFENALTKLRELEETNYSSSMSQSDEDTLKKRKPKRSSRYRDYLEEYDDSEEEYLPQVPKPYPSGRNFTKKTNTHRYMSNNKEINKKSFNSQAEVNKEANRKLVDQEARLHKESVEQEAELHNNSSEVLELEKTLVAEPLVTFNELNNCCRKTLALVTRALTKLEILSTDVKYLMEIVRCSSVVDEVENPFTEKFPFSTDTELTEFDNKLKDDDGFFQNICAALQVVGGSDVSDATRRLLSKIIAHPLSLTYNWSGKGKNPFKELKYVHKLILACLRKGPLTRNATEKEVEAVIKVWLRTAPDRNGGRGKRREKRTED